MHFIRDHFGNLVFSVKAGRRNIQRFFGHTQKSMKVLTLNMTTPLQWPGETNLEGVLQDVTVSVHCCSSHLANGGLSEKILIISASLPLATAVLG